MVAFVDMSCIIPYAGPPPKAASKPPSKPPLHTTIPRPSVNPPRPSVHALPPRPQFLQPPQPLPHTLSRLSHLPPLPPQTKSAPSVPTVSVYVREITPPNEFDERFAMLDQMDIGSRTANNLINNNQCRRYDNTGDIVSGGESNESFDRKSGCEDESTGLTPGHPAQFQDKTAPLKHDASERSTHVGSTASKPKRVRFSEMEEMGSWKLVEDHDAVSERVTTDETTTMLASHDVSQLGVLKKPENINGPLGLPLSVSTLAEAAVLEDSRDKARIEGGEGSGLVHAEHQSTIHDDRSGSPRNIGGNPLSRCHVNDTLSLAHAQPVLSGHGQSSMSSLGSKRPSRELPPSPPISVIVPKPQTSFSRSEDPEHDPRTYSHSSKRKSQPQSRGGVDTHDLHDDTDDDDDNDDEDDNDYVDVDSDGLEDPDALLHPAKRQKRGTSARRTFPTPRRPAREVSPETTASLCDAENIFVEGFLAREAKDGKVYFTLTLEAADASRFFPLLQPLTNNRMDDDKHQNTQSTSRKSSKDTTKKRLPFSPEEDRLLVQLKEIDHLSWSEIAKRFPSRSEGTLQFRYSSKLKSSEEWNRADPTSFTSDSDEEHSGSRERSRQRRLRRPVDRYSPA